MNNVAVPTHFFKVVVCEGDGGGGGGDLSMEAYVMPNQPIPDDVPLQNFMVGDFVIQFVKLIAFSCGIEYHNSYLNCHRQLHRFFFFLPFFFSPLYPSLCRFLSVVMRHFMQNWRKEKEREGKKTDKAIR